MALRKIPYAVPLARLTRRNYPVAPEALRRDLRLYVEMWTEPYLAETIGIHRSTLARVLAGFGVSWRTIAMCTVFVERQRERLVTVAIRGTSSDADAKGVVAEELRELRARGVAVRVVATP